MVVIWLLQSESLRCKGLSCAHRLRLGLPVGHDSFSFQVRYAVWIWISAVWRVQSRRRHRLKALAAAGASRDEAFWETASAKAPASSQNGCPAICLRTSLIVPIKRATKASQTKPGRVDTYVKSLTYSKFGAGTRNRGPTVSRGQGAGASGTVALAAFPAPTTFPIYFTAKRRLLAPPDSPRLIRARNHPAPST